MATITIPEACKGNIARRQILTAECVSPAIPQQQGRTQKMSAIKVVSATKIGENGTHLTARHIDEIQCKPPVGLTPHGTKPANADQTPPTDCGLDNLVKTLVSTFPRLSADQKSALSALLSPRF